jgi:phosphopantetheine--protein transferase-like protein
MKDKIEKSVSESIANKNLAVGNDLVFLPHFKQSLTPEFKNKVYTPNELAYCDQFDDAELRYASTWAGKEAVYKAFKQLSAYTLGWNKIEIIREKIAGKPAVLLHQYPNQYLISLTIAHDNDYVWAIAVIEINKAL